MATKDAGRRQEINQLSGSDHLIPVCTEQEEREIAMSANHPESTTKAVQTMNPSTENAAALSDEGLTSDDDDQNDIDFVYIHQQSNRKRGTVRNYCLRRKISKRRTMKCLKKIAAPSKVSNMRIKWGETGLLQQSDNEIRKTKCCSSSKCFESVNLNFLRDKMLILLKASRQRRTVNLLDMCSSDGNFIFNGTVVCSRFLQIAFRYSTTLQLRVRRDP